VTDARDGNETSELTTTPIGGGRRAWLIALAALVVLGTFVYIGMSGGSSSVVPNASPTAPALAAVGTPVAAPTPLVSYDPNAIVSIRADPTAPVLYQYLGTALTINGRGVLAVLDPVGPRAYRGIYRIPVSQAAQTAQLAFDAVTASVSHDDVDRIGQWTFPISSIANGTGAPVVVLDTNGAGPQNALANPDFNSVLNNGYRLTVTTQNQGDAALMTVDIVAHPEQPFPDETYSMIAEPGDYGFALEMFRPGGYDANVPVPPTLFGQTVPLTLVVSESSGPAIATTSIGSWTVDIVKRARDAAGASPLDIHVDGRPISNSDPQVLGGGYDLLVSQVVIAGQLNLGVVLNVHAAPEPAPTDR
jgi:hypothetical protein